ncbi:hypothetical protein TNCV_980541 [Trichonephila clavipes]|uniref:Uncharacterized protein n=1 Tax=Trichonephila clavipes TaxID=2585209 RepID=A0A8X6V8B1_TRICX|nr:hypothetical protein TNCV_980541 [Trichonephila clavipes]
MLYPSFSMLVIYFLLISNLASALAIKVKNRFPVGAQYCDYSHKHRINSVVASNIFKIAWPIPDNACSRHFSCAQQGNFTVEKGLVHIIFHGPQEMKSNHDKLGDLGGQGIGFSSTNLLGAKMFGPRNTAPKLYYGLELCHIETPYFGRYV